MEVPAVFHGAFEDGDGTRAVVLANATDESQECSYVTEAGARVVIKLAPREMRLVVGAGR